MSFAGPYYESSQDIMVRADDSSIGGVDDLAGKRVCTAQGSTSYTNLVARNPDALVVVRDTYSECAQALADSDVDAVTTDQAILAGYLRQGGGTFKLLSRPFAPPELYGIGLRKGDEVFRAFPQPTADGHRRQWRLEPGGQLLDCEARRPSSANRRFVAALGCQPNRVARRHVGDSADWRDDDTVERPERRGVHR